MGSVLPEVPAPGGLAFRKRYLRYSKTGRVGGDLAAASLLGTAVSSFLGPVVMFSVKRWRSDPCHA